MAHSVPARLSDSYSAAEGRKFGTTIGAAFLVLALLGRWRGHPTSFAVFTVLGLALLAAAGLIPTSLGAVERMWMAAAKGMSRVTTPLFMAILYFVVLTPIALLRRAIGGNPLVRPASSLGYWSDRGAEEQRGSMERQF